MQLSKIFTKYQYAFLLLIIILGFFFRLYRFDGPVADWHSWRQADTSSVSRNFVKSGFDILHPKFDDLSNVPSGIDNPQGYRFVEFPIYNIFQAGLYKAFGTITIEQWGRLVSIFSSILSSIFLYLLIKKRFGVVAGFFTAFFYLFIPFNIYYSRTILPDPTMVMAILGGIYFFDRWVDEKSKIKTQRSKIEFKELSYFLLSLVLTSSALLLKPYAIFFTLPMIYISYEKFGLKMLTKWQLYVFLIISILPLVGWRNWMTQFPQGIPTNDWLFNGGNIRFKGSFFYWIFADRIGRLILGYWGTAILALGFLRAKLKNELLFVLSFVVSSLLFITVIARGNVQHDYYQILIIPTIAILLGLGTSFLLEKTEAFNKHVGYLLFFVLTFFTIFFGWYFVRDYFNINNQAIVVAGNAVDRLTPQNSKVLANYNGDTSFLYQTKRKGWASFEKPLPELIQMGAGFLALVNPTPQDLELGETYKVLEKTDQYVIFDLNKKP